MIKLYLPFFGLFGLLLIAFQAIDPPNIHILDPVYAFVILAIPNWLLGMIALFDWLLSRVFRFFPILRFYISYQSLRAREFSIFMLAMMEFLFQAQDTFNITVPVISNIAISRIVIGWVLVTTGYMYICGICYYLADHHGGLVKFVRKQGAGYVFRLILWAIVATLKNEP